MSFICVQLPEQVADDKDLTIAGIGKERLRRVIKRMKKEAKPKEHEDLGFRVLKLQRSHFTAWKDYIGDNVNRLIDMFSQTEAPLVDGWTPEGLITEVMLLEGFPLDSDTQRVDGVGRSHVTRVTSDRCAHALFTCFDNKLNAESLDGLELCETDVFVCLDSSLTDEAKLLLADRCLLKTI